MSGARRAPGWYPDPWGTAEERYFDGVAWARTTRRPGGLDTPPEAVEPSPAAATPVAAAPMSVPPSSGPPMSTAPGAPPGWHPDPWAAAALRYWDGTKWTGHVSGMPGGTSPELRLAEERTAARWAKVGLAWAGPALGVSTIAGAYQWHWIAEHWDELTTAGGNVSSNGNNGAAVAGQLAGIVILVAGVLFLLWFHRAAVLAASAGLVARRSPGWATASFVIPILNLWWPYQSTIDLLPAEHPGRFAVRRWWALWIGCTIGGVAVIVAALTLNTAVLAITTAVVVVLALLAAIAARTVVTEIAEAHDHLLARA